MHAQIICQICRHMSVCRCSIVYTICHVRMHRIAVFSNLYCSVSLLSSTDRWMDGWVGGWSGEEHPCIRSRPWQRVHVPGTCWPVPPPVLHLHGSGSTARRLSCHVCGAPMKRDGATVRRCRQATEAQGPRARPSFPRVAGRLALCMPAFPRPRPVSLIKKTSLNQLMD
jgi:hypothetical protein